VPQFELRGVLVEGRGTWFNVYNIETKESAWVQCGDTMASFAVKEYNAEREALILEYQQRSVSVALKQSMVQLIAGAGRNMPAVGLLAMPTSHSGPPLVAPALPASEIERLEQVAVEIRMRREERKKQGNSSRT
jgi:hypothetical protein